MSEEGTWHGSKAPKKQVEPIKLHLNSEPRRETPINLENLKETENDWELERQLIAAERKKNDPWRFFPVMLASILCAWLIITAVEAVMAGIVITIAKQQAEEETKRLFEEFKRHFP
jgi:hypothetical protein